MMMLICFFFNVFVHSQNLCRYEAVFYGAFSLVLMAWILFENTLIYSSKVKRLSSSCNNMEDNAIVDGRYLQLSDVRIPLTFVRALFLHLLAFFINIYFELFLLFFSKEVLETLTCISNLWYVICVHL